MIPIGAGLFAIGFLLVSAVWIYTDAKSIGARKGLVGGIANNTPMMWAVGAVLMWIIVVPVYLANRSKIQHAAEVVDHRYVPQLPGSVATTNWNRVGWAEAAQDALDHLPHVEPSPIGDARADSGVPPAGWYPDPEDDRFQCWWDGTTWTGHRTPSAT